MKTLNALLLMTALTTSAPFAQTVNFDDAKPGELPANWIGTKTGKRDPKWTVENDDDAPSKPNVLKQLGEATYPVALKNDTSLKDGFVEVKVKAISGKEDQAAGVVWRTKDSIDSKWPSGRTGPWLHRDRARDRATPLATTDLPGLRRATALP